MSNGKWKIQFTKEAIKDIKSLDVPTRNIVKRALIKVSANPLPTTEGGYGKPLKNLNGSKLSGYLKIKVKKPAIRIIYSIVKEKDIMTVIVVGVRQNNEVYKEAEKRVKKYYVNEKI